METLVYIICGLCLFLLVYGFYAQISYYKHAYNREKAQARLEEIERWVKVNKEQMQKDAMQIREHLVDTQNKFVEMVNKLDQRLK